MKEAIGLLEVFGMATAYYAADAACKAGNVEIKAFDRNKPPNADSLPVPLLIMIKLKGPVADVQAAVEAGQAAADQISGCHLNRVISRPDQGMDEFLNLSCI